LDSEQHVYQATGAPRYHTYSWRWSLRGAPRTKSEEISWGISTNHTYLAPHDLWRVSAPGATVLATGDSFLTSRLRSMAKAGLFIVRSCSPWLGMAVSRRACTPTFSSAKRSSGLTKPIICHPPKISPWPYPYDAAFMVRHDLENFTNEIAAIAAYSAGRID